MNMNALFVFAFRAGVFGWNVAWNLFLRYILRSRLKIEKEEKR